MIYEHKSFSVISINKNPSSIVAGRIFCAYHRMLLNSKSAFHSHRGMTADRTEILERTRLIGDELDGIRLAISDLLCRDIKPINIKVVEAPDVLEDDSHGISLFYGEGRRGEREVLPADRKFFHIHSRRCCSRASWR